MFELQFRFWDMYLQKFIVVIHCYTVNYGATKTVFHYFRATIGNVPMEEWKIFRITMPC